MSNLFLCQNLGSFRVRKGASKIENCPVYTFCLSVTTITLDQSSQYTCIFLSKAPIENEPDQSTEFLENCIS
jgi:hypothetical protein